MARFVLYLKGVAMGIADLIPGVSGGTIAFITGIYERLIGALKSIDLDAVKLLFTFKLKPFFKKIDGGFLLTLIAGILTSILLLAKLMQYLLENEPVMLWAFFFGLIISSIYIVLKKVKKWNAIGIIMFIVGTVGAYLVTSSGKVHLPDGPFFVFLSGAIGIIAMILPGISGSYILLILGKYSYIIGILTTFTDYLKDSLSSIVKGDFSYLTGNFPSEEAGLLVLFVLGTVTGLIAFSRVLNWLFKHHHDLAVFTLAGFMLGSLNIIWPWKNIIGTEPDHKGVMQNIYENTFPSEINQLFFIIIGLIIAGFAIVYLIDRMSIPPLDKKDEREPDSQV
jgi:putative membrane protein